MYCIAQWWAGRSVQAGANNRMEGQCKSTAARIPAAHRLAHQPSAAGGCHARSPQQLVRWTARQRSGRGRCCRHLWRCRRTAASSFPPGHKSLQREGWDWHPGRHRSHPGRNILCMWREQRCNMEGTLQSKDGAAGSLLASRRAEATARTVCPRSTLAPSRAKHQRPTGGLWHLQQCRDSFLGHNAGGVEDGNVLHIPTCGVDGRVEQACATVERQSAQQRSQRHKGLRARHQERPADGGMHGCPRKL